MKVFLSVSHALATGYRNTELEVNWELPPFWSALITLDGAVQVARELLSCRSYVQQYRLARQDVPTIAKVASLLLE